MIIDITILFPTNFLTFVQPLDLTSFEDLSSLILFVQLHMGRCAFCFFIVKPITALIQPDSKKT